VERERQGGLCIVVGDEGTGERMKSWRDPSGEKNQTVVTVVELAVLSLCFVVVLEIVEKTLSAAEMEDMEHRGASCLLGRMSGPVGPDNLVQRLWRFQTETPETDGKRGQSGCW